MNVGQRVLVHQSGGIRFDDDGAHTIPHDCSDPELHWESRVLGWSEYHHMPIIATRLYPGTNGRVNPNHAEWPYTEASLTPINDGEDWVTKSAHKVGDKISFVWPNNIHYPEGSVLEGEILAAHINQGDWYIGTEVPDKGGFLDERTGKPIPPVPGATWTFKLVVNEKDFKQSEK